VSDAPDGPGMTTGLLPLMIVGLCLSVAGVYAFSRSPQLGILCFLATVAFVPIWIGASAVIYLPAVTVVGAWLMIAMAVRGLPRWTLADLLVLFIFAIALLTPIVAPYSLTAVFDVLTYWVVGYGAGRLVMTHMDPRDVYRCMAIVFVPVAVLSLVEFSFGWHGLAQFGPPTALHQFWGEIQMRGGLVRSEGAFGHSIALAVSLAMVAVTTVEARGSRAWRVAAIAIMVAGIAVTLSRLGLICAVIGLVGCVVLLRSREARRVRAPLSIVLGVGAVILVPLVGEVLARAGTEATASSSYRSDLTANISRITWLGVTDAMQRSPYGRVFYGGFRSIDSELLLMGMLYGWLVLGLLLMVLVALVVSVLRGRASAPTIAVVAHVPALATVALITQYHLFFWFVLGLAVASTAGSGLTAVSAEAVRVRQEDGEGVRT
jgi:hypothetical protein